MVRDAIEKILDTYTLVEILEMNDLTEVDVLHILVERSLVQLPDPLPVDV